MVCCCSWFWCCGRCCGMLCLYFCLLFLGVGCSLLFLDVLSCFWRSLCDSVLLIGYVMWLSFPSMTALPVGQKVVWGHSSPLGRIPGQSCERTAEAERCESCRLSFPALWCDVIYKKCVPTWEIVGTEERFSNIRYEMVHACCIHCGAGAFQVSHRSQSAKLFKSWMFVCHILLFGGPAGTWSPHPLWISRIYSAVFPPQEKTKGACKTR